MAHREPEFGYLELPLSLDLSCRTSTNFRVCLDGLIMPSLQLMNVLYAAI
jgi:hypothetical protein